MVCGVTMGPSFVGLWCGMPDGVAMELMLAVTMGLMHMAELCRVCVSGVPAWSCSRGARNTIGCMCMRSTMLVAVLSRSVAA